jgi:hypothetical protein
MTRITQSDLQAYLDEALPPDEMATLETALRSRPDLLRQLALINGRRDAGVHSVGEIWRRQRLSCPSRQHLRYCQANLEDLRRQQQENAETVKTRRTKYFKSTAGHLRKKS